MRVVVADDVLLTRAGIVRLLRDAGIEVVAEAEDAEGLLRHVRLERPDVALVDIRMPPSHTDEGLVAAQTIRSEHAQIGVLVLSQYVEPSYAMRLIHEHPERVGYLLKERVFDIATVVDALRRIVDGETVIDPTIVSRLIGRRRREDPLAALSQREREVLGLIAEGMSNRAIAARLFVTERTVEAHVTQIFQKLRLPGHPASIVACWPSSPSSEPDAFSRLKGRDEPEPWACAAPAASNPFFPSGKGQPDASTSSSDSHPNVVLPRSLLTCVNGGRRRPGAWRHPCLVVRRRRYQARNRRAHHQGSPPPPCQGEWTTTTVRGSAGSLRPGPGND